MILMVWKEEYSVGIADIDNQHKRLFELVNKVHDAMSVGKSKDVLNNVFKELIDYTKTHFSNEERFLQSINYPETTAHKGLHKDLVVEVQIYKQRMDSGELGLSIEIMKFLKAWLNDHILGEDKRYGRFYSEHNLKRVG